MKRKENNKKEIMEKKIALKMQEGSRYEAKQK